MDSINSDDQLHLVKRTTAKRNLIIFALVCGACLGVGVLIGWFSHHTKEGVAVPPKEEDSNGTVNGKPVQPEEENSFKFIEFVVVNVNAERIREKLREYSKEPRLAGTEQDAVLAQKIQDDWKENGLEEVHLATYNILLSFPNTSAPNLIQIINSTSKQMVFEANKLEVVLTPAENDSHVVPPYNSFSAAGDVTGDLVYVNYGTVEDFKYLTTNLSINLTGRIVISRYGEIYRGEKVENAAHFGASGIILYSDPSDFNVNITEPYPHSWWLPPTGIQRGSIAGDGDYQTPLYPSTYYAYRVPQSRLNLPKIPCQPVGYIDAQRLLQGLAGPIAPTLWQGHLNFTYHIGPGYNGSSELKVRLNVNNYLEVKPIYNVIGYIKGSEEPDRYVLLGNHHDAWVFGAVDPLSGSASMTELTHIFGQLFKKGLRPRRTLVFCSWDAEEEGLMGSIEWVEEHLKVLNQRGVAYLNLDYSAAANFTVTVGTSPLLQDALYDAAKLVPSHDPAFQTLYDLWLHRPVLKKENLTEPWLTYSPGSSSDQAAFYQRAGVSSLDIWMTYDEANLPILSYPLYHSSYDTFYAFENFIDPGFKATAAITRMLGVLASILANSKLLPMKVERYSKVVSSFYSSMISTYKDLWEQKGVNIEALDSAVQNFTAATRAFQKKLDNDEFLIGSPLKLRMINDRLIQLERIFLDPEGLPGRPAQKHIMFAPSQFDAYVDNSFPGIVDTMVEIEKGLDKWDQLKQQVYITTYTIQSAASSLGDVGL